VTTRPKILIFVMTNFSRSDGGVLWARNMLECFSRLHDLEFIIVTAGPGSVKVANEAYTRSLGFRHIFVPFKAAAVSKQISNTINGLWDTLSDKYYFMFERETREQAHVDSEVLRAIDAERPDLVVVNGRGAALHAPSAFSLKTPCCWITLDNEASFHQLHRSLGGPLGDGARDRVERWLSRRANWIPNRRYRRHVDEIYRRCIGIVALTGSDLPVDLSSRVVSAIIPPVLKRSERRWVFTGGRSILFVGSIYVTKWIHVPNRLAIEWICTEFSPALLAVDASAIINIIGATSEQVPSHWRQANVNFLGRADSEELARQMTSAELSIAPVSNNHGAKLKLAECVSHGMPFLATQSAMSGLPFLTSMPRIDLAQADAAARLAVDLMNDPADLMRLSKLIDEQARLAQRKQDAAWGDFFRRAIEAAHMRGKGILRVTPEAGECQA
jgi:hypothetical protein